MGEGGKKQQLQGSGIGSIVVFDLKSVLSIRRTRRTKVFALGFFFAFVACTACIVFSPSSGGGASPWFGAIFVSPSSSAAAASSFVVARATPYGSRISTIFSFFFPNSSLASSFGGGGDRRNPAKFDDDAAAGGVVEDPERNRTVRVSGAKKGGDEELRRNRTITIPSKDLNSGRRVGPTSSATDLHGENEAEGGLGGFAGNPARERNRGEFKVSGSDKEGVINGKRQIGLKNQTITTPAKDDQTRNLVASRGEGVQLPENQNSDGGGSTLTKTNGSLAPPPPVASSEEEANWLDSLISCDFFHGKWVEDDDYPLYPEGSCPHIDESFDCYLNGRPDRAFLKLRWKPFGCNIPRLNATDMLERLRGKRLVFVGDSLNRNMWESLVCVLRHSVVDKSKVFEMSGKNEFKAKGSYSFMFKDYGCTIEFYRTPFLVQEWEITDSHGKKKETLRLDLIEQSSSKYKDAGVLVFNTGHWWTHEKTAKGKDYYQEGSHVYNELNMFDAFTKALRKWANWVDRNVDNKKTLVFFRGYSASHFSGGQWNSGGQCDDEVEPIRNDTHLTSYPPMMRILEGVLKEMKAPVTYLNVTRMTDYRKDAHPSIYVKPNLTERERKGPRRFQDCSHWCLPGVPDSWNELLYAQLLIKQHLQQQQQHQ